VVLSVFNNPEAYVNRTVGAVAADNTCTEYAAMMSKVLGKTIQYNYIPRDVFVQFPFAGAEELANMFEVQRLYIPDRQIDMLESYRLNPAMQGFEQWLQKNKEGFTEMLETQQQNK
jgi:hypothetical protein